MIFVRKHAMCALLQYCVSIRILGDGTHIGVAIKHLDRHGIKMTTPDTDEVLPSNGFRHSRVGYIPMLTSVMKYVKPWRFLKIYCNG